ncbi:MAG: LCP family protein [Bacteroidales bacterium]|nr:LCP family protein [Bacteroidales bacterium]
MSKVKFTGTDVGKKHRSLGKVLTAWVIILAIIAFLIFIGVKVFLRLGYNHLRNNATSLGPNILVESDKDSLFTGATDVEGLVWQDNWISYDGKVYEYNDNILTFLIMGIDEKKDTVHETTDKTGGGQADALFLAVLNPDTQDIKMIGVNRDTMVDVVAVGMGENGEDKLIEAEIATQHGFGGGMEYSCELTRDAVSKLFYDLPIHGYLSYNLSGVVALNDKLGGVTLNALEDLDTKALTCKKGEKVTLIGNAAYNYIQYRDTKKFESARGRLNRQKQYLSKLGKLTFEKMKKDITLPVSLYTEFKDYIVTDLSVDEISWLASEMSKYEFSGDEIYTMEGTTEMGDKYEQFYPDKEALKKLMIEVFYKEVPVN